MKSISMEELSKYMGSGALLIDVRLPGDYALDHLAGAINMPANNALSMLKSYSKDTIIILYCDYGHQSSRIGRLLVGLNYTNVYVLTGVNLSKKYK